MTRYRAYIFDLDGTLYRGDEVIEDAVETVRTLRERGAQIRYLTNNSGQTRAFFAEKLSRMGFGATPEDVTSSASGTAAKLGGGSAYVIGMPGLVQSLREAGITVVNANDHGQVGEVGEQADATVVGICREPLTYALLAGGMNQILRGSRFIATNADSTFPLEGRRLSPGAGAIVAAVQTCSGVEPFVVGKPQPYLVQLVLDELQLPPSDVLVVGDRLDTDILSGRNAGCPTHLVLTGVCRELPNGETGSRTIASLLD